MLLCTNEGGGHHAGWILIVTPAVQVWLHLGAQTFYVAYCQRALGTRVFYLIPEGSGGSAVGARGWLTEPDQASTP